VRRSAPGAPDPLGQAHLPFALEPHSHLPVTPWRVVPYPHVSYPTPPQVSMTPVWRPYRMRPIALIAITLPALVLALTAPAPAAPEDLDALLDGVQEIASPGCIPGPVCVFGPDAFSVITGTRGRARMPVVGAARLGEGRVVAFGHEGLMGGAPDGADSLRFLTNAIGWASGGGDGPARVALCGLDGLAGPLSGAGLAPRRLAPGDLAAGLADVDALIASPGSIGAELVDAVLAYIRQGGGLITGVCPWGWEQVTGKSLRADLGGNQVLAAAGLVLADGMLGETGPKGYAADRQGLELSHAGRALEALESHAAGRGALSKEDLNQVSATLGTTARAVPSGDTLFLPRVKALCESPEARCVPTSEAPVAADQALARIAATLTAAEIAETPPEKVTAHPSAEAFPGAVATDAPRVRQTVAVDTSVPDWHSTGLYAAPGEAIGVTLPESAAGKGLSVRIGCHTDGIWHLDQWKRFPEVARAFALDRPTTRAANAFGGLVYIVVPRGCELGSIDVTIEGAVEAPLFVYGRTSRSTWRDTLRHAPGPWAELATDSVVITVPSSAIRELDDPEALLAFWNHVMDCCADLAAWPRERERPERYVPDVQISAGYMHSGYPIMTHLDAAPLSVDRQKLVSTGSWGHFHEMGHNHQSGHWTFDGAGEVTVNLFSLYVSERACDLQSAAHPAVTDELWARAEAHMAAPDFGKWKSDPFLALAMYMQLQRQFGWGAFTRVFAGYAAADPATLPRSDAEKRDQWMVRFSREVGCNLGPFFDAWGVPVSEEAKASIADLVVWMPAG